MKRNSVGTTAGRPSLRFLLAFLTIPAVWLAAAEKPHDKTFDTTREPLIRVNNLRGRVLLRGWDKARVHVVYTVVSPRVEVDNEVLPESGPAERLRFETHLLDARLVSDEQVTDFIFDVPAGASLEIHNRQGSVVVEGMQADASLQSVNGDITVRDYSGHLSVHSISGNIEVMRAAGILEASTITGSLHFVSPATTSLHGSTTSGRITYEGDFSPRGEYVLSAYSGDVDILCPPSASYELTAKTLRGKVSNSLVMNHRREAATPMEGASSLLGTHNTGKASLEITSFSGNINIRPQ